MNWSAELAELEQRKVFAQAMGGPEKVARQHANGKLTVRERVEQLVDSGSFVEVGGLAGSGEYDEAGRLKSVVPSNVVLGRAQIDQRPVVVIGDDFTVRGGANDGAVGDKMIFAEQMAYDLRIPMVRLVDGTGGGGSVKNIEKMGHALLPKMKIWASVARNLSRVPVVSMALGSVAGQGAARVAGSHYSLMVKDTSQLFIAGPPVVEKIGQHLTKNELGGSQIHARNGVVDDEVATEAQAFEAARRFLSYLPASVHEVAERSTQPVTVADQQGLRNAVLGRTVVRLGWSGRPAQADRGQDCDRRVRHRAEASVSAVLHHRRRPGIDRPGPGGLRCLPRARPRQLREEDGPSGHQARLLKYPEKPNCLMHLKRRACSSRPSRASYRSV